jgi:hypothetical protein
MLLTLVVVRYHKILIETLQGCKFCDYTTLNGQNALKRGETAGRAGRARWAARRLAAIAMFYIKQLVFTRQEIDFITAKKMQTR